MRCGTDRFMLEVGWDSNGPLQYTRKAVSLPSATSQVLIKQKFENKTKQKYSPKDVIKFCFILDFSFYSEERGTFPCLFFSFSVRL